MGTLQITDQSFLIMKDLPVCLLGHIYCDIKHHNIYRFDRLFLSKSVQMNEAHKKRRKNKVQGCLILWEKKKKEQNCCALNWLAKQAKRWTFLSCCSFMTKIWRALQHQLVWQGLMTAVYLHRCLQLSPVLIQVMIVLLTLNPFPNGY